MDTTYRKSASSSSNKVVNDALRTNSSRQVTINQDNSGDRPRRNRRAPDIFGRDPSPPKKKSNNTSPKPKPKLNLKIGRPRKSTIAKRKLKKISFGVTTDGGVIKNHTDALGEKSIADAIENVTVDVALMKPLVEEIAAQAVRTNESAEKTHSAVAALTLETNKPPLPLARNNVTSISLTSLEEEEAEEPIVMVSVADLIESDKNTEKENNEELLDQSVVLDKVLDQPPSSVTDSQVPPSTNAGNIGSGQANVMRTPPASILRHPDSPRAVGRRVHFDVESTDKDCNSFKRWPKFGLMSPLCRQSPTLSAVLPTAVGHQNGSSTFNSLAKRRLRADASRANKDAAAQSPTLKRSTSMPLADKQNIITQNDQKDASIDAPSSNSQAHVAMAFMPDYVGLTDPIRPKICQMLAPYTGSKSLMSQLQSRSIKTVGELARLSEVELSPLLIKAQPTKISKARSVLAALYGSQIVAKQPATASMAAVFDSNVISALSSATTAALTPNQSIETSTMTTPSAKESAMREKFSTIAQRIINEFDYNLTLTANTSKNVESPAPAVQEKLSPITQRISDYEKSSALAMPSVENTELDDLLIEMDLSQKLTKYDESWPFSSAKSAERRLPINESISSNMDWDVNYLPDYSVKPSPHEDFETDELEPRHVDLTAGTYKDNSNVTVPGNSIVSDKSVKVSEDGTNLPVNPERSVLNGQPATNSAQSTNPSADIVNNNVSSTSTGSTMYLSDDNLQIVGESLLGESKAAGGLIRTLAQCGRSAIALPSNEWTVDVNVAALNLVKTLIPMINIKSGDDGISSCP